jgi:hypothetical protein
MSDIPNIPLTDENLSKIIGTYARHQDGPVFDHVRQVFSEDRSRLVYHEGSNQRGYIVHDRTNNFVIVDFGEGGGIIVDIDYLVLVDNPPTVKPPPFVRVRVSANITSGTQRYEVIGDINGCEGYLTGVKSDSGKFQVDFGSGRLVWLNFAEIIIEDVQCQK